MQRQVAVITGASSGIGAALAEALAARGTQVVLVARSAARLEEVAERLRSAGAIAHVLPMDLAEAGAAQSLHAAIRAMGLAVDTLINNAAIGHYGPFEAEPRERLTQALHLNVVALAELTRLFVPELLLRKGTILNIASTAALQPTPFMSSYGATKAFVLSFSEALWAEYHHRGLHVAALCPGPVETPFIDAMGPGVRRTAIFRKTMPIEAVVKAGLKALDSTRPTRILGAGNWVSAQMIRFAPRALTARLSAAMLKPREFNQ
ncbi:MAG: SDR family oxidoreductase [Roseomonas sp.]|nr:SDR family oxidoreductase [Roseomonas sp.]